MVSFARSRASDTACATSVRPHGVARRRLGDSYPEIIPSVDIPLDEVSVVLGKVRIEAMLLLNALPLLIASLLVLFIMAMLRIELE